MKYAFSIPVLVLAILLASCNTTKKIKDGDTAYQQKQYAVAVDMLTREVAAYEEGEEYARLSFMLGESYKNLNDSPNALKWFIEAAKNNYGEISYWRMAAELRKSERYDDAILTYGRMLKFSDRQNDIKLEIEKCKKASEWAKLTAMEEWDVSALRLNSDASDYAPTLWQGNQLVFTSDRLYEDEDPTYLWTGNSFSDIYVTSIGGNNPMPMEGGINTEDNEGTPTFTKDGDQVFFTRCFSEVGDSYCRIMKATLLNGEWIDQEPAFPMKRRVNYRDPVLIENDSVLILVSDDPTGIGGSDLYVSFLLEDGTWEAPSLMPPYLNSIGEERFPTWDGEVLYFSSDHFPGLGGLDIFQTRLNEDNSWTQPQNLMKPWNSSQDDYGYTKVAEEVLPQEIKSMVFFTSTRSVFGNDDIYWARQFREVGDTTSVDIPVEKIIVEESKSHYLNIKIVEKIFAVADNPNSFVVGERPVSGASVKITTGNEEEILISDANGVVLIPIDTFQDYNLLAGKRGYLNQRGVKEISEAEFTEKPDGFVFQEELEIEKIYEGVDITLENIYYDFNESFIREDAKPALDYLIRMLVDNPGISIALSSHTDCRGEEDLNLDLSQRRAAAAVAYIQEEGAISPDRLQSFGYGKSKPELDCECNDCSEEEHQINRRTTFAINQ